MSTFEATKSFMETLAHSRRIFRYIFRVDRQIDAIDLFDRAWYANKYMLHSATEDHFEHFMRHGWKKGYDPNPFFDVKWYRRRYNVKGNPLVNYVRWTRIGRRSPHPLFDREWYLSAHRDVAAAGMEPLFHFLHRGRYEKRSPHPLFDAQWYSRCHSKTSASVDPFFHYLSEGAAALFDPHPVFDSRWYATRAPTIGPAHASHLAHFLEHGWTKRIDPHPLFSVAWYLERYPDVRDAGVNPLVHYLRYGASEGRDPHEHFQTSWYTSAYPDIASEGVNPLAHFVLYGMREGRRPNFLFDPLWYSRQYGNLIEAEMPPFMHFLKYGRYAGLQPGPFFSPETYRSRYADRGEGPSRDPGAAVIEFARANPESQRKDMSRRLVDVARMSSYRDRAANGVSPLPLPGEAGSDISSGSRATIAVQIHLYYLDMARSLICSLACIPVPFDLFISIPDASWSGQIETMFRELENLDKVEIKAVENRGRDIGPFLVAFGNALVGYRLVLHLHTKKSPHNSLLSGWFEYLIDNLLGSRENVAAILTLFDENEQAGMLYPPPYEPVFKLMRLGGNSSAVRSVLNRTGERIESIDPLIFSSFPAGSMCWMRGSVVASMCELRLTFADFPPENASDDGTLAHAIERLFPLFALKTGVDPIQYARDDIFDDWGGVWRAPATLETDVLIVDHDIGGGARRFIDREIDKYLALGEQVVRIFSNPVLMRATYQHFRNGKVYYSAGPENETFAQSVRRCNSREIVINSLYGLDHDIGALVATIEKIKRDRDLIVRLMVHDFHLACPSQHLLDARQKYCGLPPMESDACVECIRANENIPRDWRKYFTLSQWRRQSQALLELADEVRFFDASGLEILAGALDIRRAAAAFVPHEPPGELRPVDVKDRWRMNIGVLGTLQYAKGIEVINELARYLRDTGRHDRIVLIGEHHGELDRFIHVHGRYNVEDLPSIIEAMGVNIVFVSSVIPETFCYTLSEAMEMRLPIAGFDIGAQGNRLRDYERGRVLPIDSTVEDIYATLAGCWRAHGMTHTIEA